MVPGWFGLWSYLRRPSDWGPHDWLVPGFLSSEHKSHCLGPRSPRILFLPPFPQCSFPIQSYQLVPSSHRRVSLPTSVLHPFSLAAVLHLFRGNVSVIPQLLRELVPLFASWPIFITLATSETNALDGSTDGYRLLPLLHDVLSLRYSSNPTRIVPGVLRWMAASVIQRLERFPCVVQGRLPAFVLLHPFLSPCVMPGPSSPQISGGSLEGAAQSSVQGPLLRADGRRGCLSKR